MAKVVFRVIGLLTFLASFPSYANVVGPDMQNFNATPDGLDFVTVQSSQTLRPGVFNLGLFLNYAANTLPRFPESSSSASGKLEDRLLGADFNFAAGVTRNFQLGLSLPHILLQSVKSDDHLLRGQFGKAGTTEVRPSAKYRLVGNSHGGLAALGHIGINMIDGNAWLGDGAGPIFTFELAADRKLTKGIGAGVNVGYRKRNPGKKMDGAPVEPLGDQYIGSVATSILIPAISSKLVGEIFGSMPVKKTSDFGDRAASSAEVLGGLKHDATENLSLHAGVGKGLEKGIASPDWRLYVGLNYTLGPVYKHRQAEDVRRRTKPRKTPKQPLKLEDSAPEVEELVSGSPFAKAPEYGQETFVLSSVMFAFDKDREVLEGTKEILRQLVEYLHKDPPFVSLLVEGHTDYVGSDGYNQNLSERRAASIKRYLVDKLGLDANKITTVGYGESRPIADNGNYQGRQLNRRVEFKINR